MKAKIYFNVDKVSRIIVSFEQPTKHRFLPAVEPRQVTFLGIPLYKTNSLPARWTEGNGEYYTEDDRIRDSIWYRVQDLPKMVFTKPLVVVNMGYHETIQEYFESDLEAQEFVDEVVSMSKNTFEVIVKK